MLPLLAALLLLLLILLLLFFFYLFLLPTLDFLRDRCAPRVKLTLLTVRDNTRARRHGTGIISCLTLNRAF